MGIKQRTYLLMQSRLLYWFQSYSLRLSLHLRLKTTCKLYSKGPALKCKSKDKLHVRVCMLDVFHHVYSCLALWRYCEMFWTSSIRLWAEGGGWKITVLLSQTFAAYLQRKLLLPFIKLSATLLAHTILNLKCLALFLGISSECQTN